MNIVFDFGLCFGNHECIEAPRTMRPIQMEMHLGIMPSLCSFFSSTKSHRLKVTCSPASKELDFCEITNPKKRTGYSSSGVGGSQV